MEPQMIDHYNELPHSVNVIERMNEELYEVQKENKKLKMELEGFHKLMNRFNMPRIKVDTVEEYQLFESKLEGFENWFRSEQPENISNEYINSKRGSSSSKYNDFITDTINKLDELTNHINREWCQCRILTSIDMFIKTEGDIHCEEEVCLINIIIGLNNNSDEEQLPKIYCELSNKFIPEWSQSDEHINMMNIPYYKCEKCGKYDDGGETEIYGGLFCIDCQPLPQ